MLFFNFLMQAFGRLKQSPFMERAKEYIRSLAERDSVRRVVSEFRDASLQNVVLYCLLAIVIIFIISRLSGILFWLAVAASAGFIGYKIYSVYFKKS